MRGENRQPPGRDRDEVDSRARALSASALA